MNLPAPEQPPPSAAPAASMEKRGTILMHRYELGRLLGRGTFAKVYHARNILTHEAVAIKVMDKDKLLQVGMSDQVKREIAIMRLVRHPNIVRLYEVMATKTKIFFAIEYASGGELFARVARGRLHENDARRFFQQLVAAIDFCHSRGVYHRDLKPENLLLDDKGTLKVTDFGLSALGESCRPDGLLHTTCGTPAYVAPEVICRKGYDGAKADVWSCGVILFVLLTGFLPFQDTNLAVMYRKISRGEFRFPNSFPSDARRLISRLLDPNPATRLTVAKLVENPWFAKGFRPAPAAPLIVPPENFFSWEEADGTTEIEEEEERERRKKMKLASGLPPLAMKPASLNAFDIISRSSGFDLSGLFEKGGRRAEASFTTMKPAAAIMSKLEEIGVTESFRVRRTAEGKVKMQGSKAGRKGQLAIDAEIFEVTPSFHVVEMKKAAGDTLEYQEFCDQGLKPSLKDIVWTWQEGETSAPTEPTPPLSGAEKI